MSTMTFNIWVLNLLVMFSTLSAFEFQHQFTDTTTCLAYLADMKWEYGYQFRRDICKDYTKGYQPFTRGCKEFRCDESTTAHIIFHNLKSHLIKAFYGVFRCCKKKGISSYELAKEIEVSPPTAWLFPYKLQQAMESGGKFPLIGEVHIDECVTGGPEPAKPGRSDGKKKKSLTMVEVRDNNKTEKVFCKQINNYKKKNLYPITSWMSFSEGYRNIGLRLGKEYVPGL